MSAPCQCSVMSLNPSQFNAFSTAAPAIEPLPIVTPFPRAGNGFPEHQARSCRYFPDSARTKIPGERKQPQFSCPPPAILAGHHEHRGPGDGPVSQRNEEMVVPCAVEGRP
jgi:hypothetical protein